MRPGGVDLDPRAVRHAIDEPEEGRLVLAQSGGVDVVGPDVPKEEGTGGQQGQDDAEAELRRAVVEFQSAGRGRRGCDYARGSRFRRRRHDDDNFASLGLFGVSMVFWK